MARGDLICIDYGLFKHWAVDVGDGLAIENARYNGGCVDCKAIRELIGDRQSKWKRVSESPLRREMIARWAESQVGTCSYNLFRNNCEHFAQEAATGVRSSAQIKTGAVLLVLGLLIWFARRGRAVS